MAGAITLHNKDVPWAPSAYSSQRLPLRELSSKTDAASGEEEDLKVPK